MFDRKKNYSQLAALLPQNAKILVVGGSIEGQGMKLILENESYFDRFSSERPGAYDAASGYYFMGRKSDRSITYQELLQQFQGIT